MIPRFDSPSALCYNGGSMKYVITAAEAACFTGLSPQTICAVLRSNGNDLPHIWETENRTAADLRIMSFPFIRYLKGHISNEKIERLRNYIKV